MFISLSKTIGRVGGFRIGIGKRITAKNAWWMFLIMAFVYLGQFMWYMLVLMFWLMYAMCYGMWWLMKAMFKGIASLFSGGASLTGKAVKAIRESDDRAITTKSISSPANLNSNNNYPQMQPTSYVNMNQGSEENVYKNKFCTECGKPITPGNKFCTACGKPVS